MHGCHNASPALEQTTLIIYAHVEIDVWWVDYSFLACLPLTQQARVSTAISPDVDGLNVVDLIVAGARRSSWSTRGIIALSIGWVTSQYAPWR